MPDKKNPYDQTGETTTTTTTDTTNTSTSTPSSGGASSAPAIDPITRSKMSMFQSIYQSLWGEPATEDYLKAAAKQGFNSHEFEDRERHKPAFVRTERYKQEASAALSSYLRPLIGFKGVRKHHAP